MASDFAREAWILVGDVAAVRAAFEVSQLIPDWLEQCRAYDEEASDTCKSLADSPRPREGSWDHESESLYHEKGRYRKAFSLPM